MMLANTRYAKTKARAMSEEDVLSHTSTAVLQTLSFSASVLQYSWSLSETRFDIMGKTDRSKTFVYGPSWVLGVFETYYNRRT